MMLESAALGRCSIAVLREFLEVFHAGKYEGVSLAEWFSHLPPERLMQHSNLTGRTLRGFRAIDAGSSRRGIASVSPPEPKLVERDRRTGLHESRCRADSRSADRRTPLNKSKQRLIDHVLVRGTHSVWRARDHFQFHLFHQRDGQ